MPVAAALLAASYFAGSIPFGLLIARAVSGKDVRAVGSGNIGATNVARAAGRGAALATLLLDALKGLGPVLIARSLPPPWLAPACGLAAVLGHCFPIWLRFRGGKGVATGLGVALALAPWAALAGVIAWLLVWKVLRLSSVGSLLGTLVTVVAAAFTASHSAVLALVLLSALILLRHRKNLERLLGRTER